jgi:hypothetical protein
MLEDSKTPIPSASAWHLASAEPQGNTTIIALWPPAEQ